MLYRRLRLPSLSADEMGGLERRVHAFSDDESLRNESARALRPLTKTSSLALAPILYGAPPPLPRGGKLFPFATIATVVAAGASFVWPFALVLLLGCVFGSIAVRFYVHDQMSAQATALRSIVNLVSAAQNLVVIKAHALEPELGELRHALTEVQGYRASISWLTTETLHANEIVAMFITYLNVVLLLDVHAFMRSLQLVHRHARSLARLLETVGELDAARSIANFRAGVHTSAPTFTARGTSIHIEGMRHPLVEDAVPNDVELDASKGWLVMGSNMSGKSTCLRAIAVNALLAQSIGSVTADSYSAPLLLVRTLINVEDDVLAGRSHFLAEAEAGRDMLLEAAAGRDRLCIIDELFRGTNTVDRVAAASAFLRALHRDGAFVVAATHDSELIALLSDSFRSYYFEESVQGSALTFDYRLREGPMAPRNALAVLELVGFPAHVIEDARATASRAG